MYFSTKASLLVSFVGKKILLLFIIIHIPFNNICRATIVAMNASYASKNHWENRDH